MDTNKKDKKGSCEAKSLFVFLCEEQSDEANHPFFMASRVPISKIGKDLSGNYACPPLEGGRFRFLIYFLMAQNI